MKIIVFYLLLSAVLPVCFSQTTKEKQPAKSTQPTMTETAAWLMEKFGRNKKDSIKISQSGEKTADEWYVTGLNMISYYYTPLEFKIENQYLTFKYIDACNTGVPAHEKRWFTDTCTVTADLSTIDTLRIGKDSYVNFRGDSRALYFYSRCFQIKTKNGFESIIKKTSRENNRATQYRTDAAYILLPANTEPDIQQRFIKALNHYIRLCKQKYPIKKEIF